MKGRLKVFGIELSDWEKFWGNWIRQGLDEKLNRVAKITVQPYQHNNDPPKWLVWFWDELQSFRLEAQQLEKELKPEMTPEEVVGAVDDLLVRLEKLESFR